MHTTLQSKTVSISLLYPILNAFLSLGHSIWEVIAESQNATKSHSETQEMEQNGGRCILGQEHSTAIHTPIS